MNIYIVLSLAIVLNALANILMKVAMRKQDKTTEIIEMVIQSLSNPTLFLGIFSFALALVAYCYVLSKLNLSIAYPLMTSLGFLIVILASWLFLGEAITKIQIIGFICITAGVWMVAR
jgi:multidrug transporter EmrE-like cation transporter